MRINNVILAAIAAWFLTITGCNDKVSNGPEPEPEPVPAAAAFTTAKWEFTNSNVSEGASAWQNGNKATATAGSASNAYFSVEAGGNTKPMAVVHGNMYCAANMNTGDAIVFTQPSTTLAKGSTVDFMLTICTSSEEAPKYWICEYFEDGKWKIVEEDLRTATEDPSLKYSFYIKAFSSEHYTTFVQSFTLDKDLNNAELKVRCRVVGNINNAGGTLSPSASAYVGLARMYYQGAVLNTCQGVAVKDTRKVLVLGNSFTFYYSTAFMLKEIARSQGHQIRMCASLKGSQYLRDHSSLELSQAAIREGGYDYAILQDQSGQHARYFKSPTANAAVLSETGELVEQIINFSPSVQPVLENTWAFQESGSYNGYGCFELFDKALQGGALLICDALNIWMSPVGIAFEKARAAGITDLYHTDSKHPNRNGAYLKSCVNYLLMYGESFDGNVPDCLVPSSTAAKLRAIAEEVVLGHENEYRDPDASAVKPEEVPVVAGENGIRTAAQLISFASVFNRGGDISSYRNAAGEVALLDDIDLAGAVWTPVGTSTGVSLSYNAGAVPSYPFTGVFNGYGHTISNFKLVVDDNQTNVMGFIGAAKDATIKNVSFTGVTMDYNSTGISTDNIAIGTVLGYGYNTIIENVSANAVFAGKATSVSDRNVLIGGIAGGITATSAMASKLVNCSFSGRMTNDIGTKYSNGNTACVAGILGAVTDSGDLVLIKGCTNNAEMDVKTHRAAGIVCNGFHTNIENCVNNGHITASYSSSKAGTLTGVRMGGIMAYCSFTSTNSSYIKDCRNHGTIATTETGSAAGGVVGLMRTFKVSGSINTGDVIAPYGSDSRRGLLIGAITKANDPSVLQDCHLCGGVSSRMDKSDCVAATAANYLSFGVGITIAGDASCPSWNRDNVHFYGTSTPDENIKIGEGTDYELLLVENRKLADGVEYFRYTPMKFTKDVFILKVDMTNPNVDLEACYADDICPNPHFENANNGPKLREVMSASCLRKRNEGHNVIAAVNGDYYETLPGTLLGCHIQEGEPVYIPNPRNVQVHYTCVCGMTEFMDRTISTDPREIKLMFKCNGMQQEFFSVNDTIVRLSPKSKAKDFQGANFYDSRFKEIPFASTPTLSNPINSNALFIVAKTESPLLVNVGDIKAKVVSVIDGRSGNLAKAPYADEGYWVLQLTGATADKFAGVKQGDDISINFEIKIGGKVKPIKTHIGGIFRFVHEWEYVPVYASKENEKKRATIAGIDESGTKAIFMVTNTTDLLYPQLAELCKTVGIKEAVRFDGGGSAEMWLWDGLNGEIACPSTDPKGPERSNMNYMHIVSKL